MNPDPIFDIDDAIAAANSFASACRHGVVHDVEHWLGQVRVRDIAQGYLRAAENGHVAVVAMLDPMVDIEARRIALQAAVTENDLVMAQVVLGERGCAILGSPMGSVSFQMAVDFCRPEMVALLAPYVSVNSRNNALTRVITRGSLSVLHALAAHCDPFKLGANLLWAAGDGMEDVVAFLLPFANDQQLVNASRLAGQQLHWTVVDMIKAYGVKKVLMQEIPLLLVNEKPSKKSRI